MVWGYLADVKDGLARGRTLDQSLDDAETVPPLFAGSPRPQRKPREHTPIDTTAGIKAREAALEAVERGAPREWKDLALEAVRACCLENPEFLADLVWQYLEERPPEPRAMGAVMRKAEKAGYCSKTDRFKPTAVVANHRAPKRVWKSNIYEEAA